MRSSHQLVPLRSRSEPRQSTLRNFIEACELLAEDVRTPSQRDAARPSRAQALLSAHSIAMASHRIAHAAQRSGFHLLAHTLAFVPRLLVGVDIHPSATIGRRVFLDHGDGIVIGGSAEVGDDVLLHHGVTLGAAWSGLTGDSCGRRHPIVADRVRIGCRACVLGAVTIGPDATIDAGCVVYEDVPPGARIHARDSSGALSGRALHRTARWTA